MSTKAMKATWARERYAKARARGQCVCCPKPAEPFARCWDCRAKHRERVYRWRGKEAA